MKGSQERRSDCMNLSLKDNLRLSDIVIIICTVYLMLILFKAEAKRLRQLYDRDSQKATGQMLDVILCSAEPGKWPMFLSALEDDGMLKLDMFWLKGRGLHKRF